LVSFAFGLASVIVVAGVVGSSIVCCSRASSASPILPSKKVLFGERVGSPTISAKRACSSGRHSLERDSMVRRVVLVMSGSFAVVPGAAAGPPGVITGWVWVSGSS
jgi:hypothetical protein